jgi:hypothetical protein
MTEDVLSKEFQSRWNTKPIYSNDILKGIDDNVHLHRELMNARSSAGACINVIGNIAKDKQDLINFLNYFKLGVEDIILFPTGATFGEWKYLDSGNVIFEWIGPRTSPLNEKGGGRGQRRTSIDAFILAIIGGKLTQLLIEWKFTETYNSPQNLRKFSGIAGNERLRRYSSCLALLREKGNFPFKMIYEGGFGLNDLGYEPFYQLLRMTLLAKLTTPTEFDNGLGIQDYRVLHFTHSKNIGLNILSEDQLKYSPGFKDCTGENLHDMWKNIILSENEAKKFYYGYWDEAIDVISNGAVKDYLINRYAPYLKG